ncbi:hypothetical protein [Streptomyces sp. NPDC050504]|uniref:hypothetical protein n=1 Tax=Streptomyces sp. NPDC050504 TaxID=3365618 RepID=UPI0037A2036B
MTTADAVRRRVGLGRLLPLGGAADGAWITERAAVAVLRAAAARAVPGAEVGTLRLGLAGAPHQAATPVTPPPSALPPGVLRAEAECAATLDAPLPTTAEALRRALLTAADERLGLLVTEVDVRVTELLDEAPGPPRAGAPPKARGADPVVLAVPGVAHLTAVLGASERLVEVATTGQRRALDVARGVRDAVGRPVAVLITWAG